MPHPHSATLHRRKHELGILNAIAQALNAAERLGIGVRTLYEKLKGYGIE
jgi:DNA-binding NtrC family response regulator